MSVWTVSSNLALLARLPGCRLPGAGHHEPWLTLAALGLLVAVAASAQAGVVSAPLQTHSAALPEPAPGSRTLDRALSPELQTGVKNLEALLEVQRAEVGEGLFPAGVAAIPAPEPARAGKGGTVSPPGAQPPGVAADALGLGVPVRRADPAATREPWNPAAAGDPRSAGNPARGAQPATGEAAFEASSTWVRGLQSARDFLRDRRAWLLGGVCSVLALALLFRLASRRA